MTTCCQVKPRAQHQLVEPVDLGAAVPDRGDRVGEPLAVASRWGPSASSGIVALRRILNW